MHLPPSIPDETLLGPLSGIEEARHRFVLRRSVDVSGVSGLGDVAEGCQFTDGTVAIRWCTGEHRSTVIWSSVEAAEAVHGHNGATVVHWLDESGWWLKDPPGWQAA